MKSSREKNYIVKGTFLKIIWRRLKTNDIVYRYIQIYIESRGVYIIITVNFITRKIMLFTGH